MVPIGLILLGIVLILLAFGVLKRMFDRMGVSYIFTIAAIALVIIGVLVPVIPITAMFSLSVGGFIIPVIAAVVLAVTIGWNQELLRAFVGVLAVAAVSLGLFYLMPAETTGMHVAAAICVGLVAGGAAYLAGNTSRASVTAALLGIPLAQILFFTINYYTGRYAYLGLGEGLFFNTMVVAVITSVVLVELVRSVKARSVMHDARRDSTAARFESGERFDFEHNEFYENQKENLDNDLDK
ncbi:MAG: hypothetical protein FWE62_00130 [Firmicutes bacterium]|nr:hypothetical protein [Bacillota bacterium]